MKHWISVFFLLVACPIAIAGGKKSPGDIEIYLSGGHLYGGINPTLSRVVEINGEGNVVISTETLSGKTQKEGKVTQKEVQTLYDEIYGLGFADLKEKYECDPKDEECAKKEVSSSPTTTPIKLRVSGPKGEKEINAKGDYPKSLDKIAGKITGFGVKAIPVPAK